MTHRAPLQLGERFVNGDDTGAGGDALGGHAGVCLAQAAQDRILDPVERGIVHMPALGGQYPIPGIVTQHLRDAQSGTGSAHRGHPLSRQRHVRPAQMLEIVIGQLRDGMADGGEIVDDRPAFDAELRAILNAPPRTPSSPKLT